MTVLLRHSGDPEGRAGLRWVALPGTAATGGSGLRRTDLARRLEAAFEAIRDDWYAAAHALDRTPGAELSVTLGCSPTQSDFGLMLAWSRLVTEIAAEGGETLVLCDDPWLFRHLAGLSGVTAGRAPALLLASLRLGLRGMVARMALAFRLAKAVLRTGRSRRNHRSGRPTLLVYGHPASKPDGTDAYFGPLLNRIDGAQRLLHVDCPPDRAMELAADGRTASLHAWGCLVWLPALMTARWRPGAASDPLSWLVRRAAAREGSTAMAASIRWQIRCQRAWLKAVSPRSIAWPWENHAWERDLVAAARHAGVRSVGYQHTVVGRHMYNQSPRVSPLGAQSLPDRLMANGPAYRADLERAGVPADRMEVAGAIRLAQAAPLPFDAAGPVFVGLSHDMVFAAQQLEAVRRAADAGPWRFLVKDHPMYPFAFEESDRIRRTEVPLQKQPPLAAVFVCTGAVGLEALLGGLPTIRLVLDGMVAQDILPMGLKAAEVEMGGLAAALRTARPQAALRWEDVLAPPDFELWRCELEAKP